jgi:hypothetical protein
MNVRPEELLRSIRAMALGLVLGVVLERLSLSRAGLYSGQGRTGITRRSP